MAALSERHEARAHLVVCPTCALVQRVTELPAGTVAECARCGATVRTHKRNSLARTAAFSLAALLFYAPANLYPILEMDLYGAHSENTVWQGCVALWKQGETLVAIVVVVASILSPVLKLLGLAFLAATTAIGSTRWRRGRTWTYKTLEVIGPWAMLDVFLVAILIALVKLGQIATVLPGRGLIAFAAVVVLTILASTSFDQALIWRAREARS
jgi:paraquat-inducible protein A